MKKVMMIMVVLTGMVSCKKETTVPCPCDENKMTEKSSVEQRKNTKQSVDQLVAQYNANQSAALLELISTAHMISQEEFTLYYDSFWQVVTTPEQPMDKFKSWKIADVNKIISDNTVPNLYMVFKTKRNKDLNDVVLPSYTNDFNPVEICYHKELFDSFKKIMTENSCDLDYTKGLKVIIDVKNGNRRKVCPILMFRIKTDGPDLFFDIVEDPS